ncbi:hypothetical protein BDP55DRAFT_726198 [Colletotrichum godetiae]|uniref:Uncharacterized protein n=1 Tax=Colletotrichum godetiae TaxID=1209918 RepID=A0AAJ0F0T2_9PEZI|nr:uncharacterized protein BDP55DRAFT_726198 [Colletotrichum godetiae]KAK1688828.1 hypothetical protein BDP55DRAFT_726198 [Colletotrichum godetiae]
MKKKSMSTLANLAPRRRGKGRKKEEKKEIQAPVTPSLPANRSGPAHPFSYPDPGGNTDPNNDPLANDLLETTIYHHPNGLRSHPSVLLCGTEPMAIAPIVSPDVQSTSPSTYRIVNLPSEDFSPQCQSDTQVVGTEETAPAIPAKSSRRQCGKQENDTENRPAILKFPHSKTTMLDPGNRHPLVLPFSTTVPLTHGGYSEEDYAEQVAVSRAIVAQALAARTAAEEAASIHATVEEDVVEEDVVAHMLGPENDPRSALINPNLVDEKTNAMLAHTKALKPPGLEKSTLPSSKTSLFLQNKVVSKVRHVFESILPKPATPESKIRGKISAPIGLTTCDLPNPAAHYHLEEVEVEVEEASIVSSIELRLNEGNNLHNQKVQSIVGDRIVRKAVTDDDSSLCCSDSPEDPFSGEFEVANRPPTPFEHRLKSSLDSTGVPPVPSLNPFDTEKDFDADLEGMLSEKPVCASTPRRPDRKAAPAESPSKRYAKADDHHLASTNDTEGGPSAPGPTPRKLKLSGGWRLFRDQPEPSTKKHPSPSKEDLEDYQDQLRGMVIEEMEKKPEQREELRTKWEGVLAPAALGPKDVNAALMSSEAKQPVAKPTVIIGEASTVSLRRYNREEFTRITTTTSRIPRPSPRYTTYNRPSNFDALDIDELQ